MRKPPILKGIVALCLFAFLGVARADNVDDLVRQLRDSDYKVRLSAALNLGKLGNSKAVAPLTDALSDSDKTVRGVAAAALGKLVNSGVPEPDRDNAINKLQTVSQNDSDSFVRSQAAKAYGAVQGFAGGGGGGGAPSGKWVYLDVKMNANGQMPGSVVPAAQQELESEVRKKAPTYLTRLPGGVSATQATAAFGLIGTLTMQVSGSTVSCKVSMVLATFPQNSAFGFLNGNGSLDAGATSPKAIEDAAKDCMSAVMDDLIDTKVVPTIQSRAGVP